MRPRYLLAALMIAGSLNACDLTTYEHHTAYRADGSIPGIDGCFPMQEVCDGIDNDCDGLVDDDDPSLVADEPDNCGQCGRVCDLPNVEIHKCENGECRIAKCEEGYSDLNERPDDGCESDCIKTLDWDPCDGVDNDCNGIVDDGYDLQNDPNNCGACDRRCDDEFPQASSHIISFSCVQGSCAIAACEENYYNRDGIHDESQGALDCEYFCVRRSTVELCNGEDDDCDGYVDNNPVDAPTCLDQGVCAGTNATCVGAGTWECQYGSDYQLIEDQTMGCDGLDNDCDGRADEGFQVGEACHVGQGDCRREGVLQCNTAGTDAECSATPGAPGTEVCDGKDNDCDGLVDEDRWSDFNGNYVRPAVVNIGGGVYMFAYEASRPNAGTDTAGTGNGYHCSSCSGVPNAPAGVPLEGTLACSVENRLPWFNVSPVEAEQTCQAIGGRVCTTSEWRVACESGSGCHWGYATQCTTPANYSNRYCNLGEYDFDSSAPGDQDGLLVTRSWDVVQCYSDWGSAGNIYDMTGNLREITKAGSNQYPLMGGAFNTSDEDAAQCTFDFYVVDSDFRLWDTGFRCCFDANPSP